jgi:ABC-2 type transport system ATP-binding protein
MILSDKLSKTFITRKSQGFFKPKTTIKHHAVVDLDLEIQPGEFVSFLGPNGAGKTTTLKMLSGILYPSSGQVQVAGYTPFKKELGFKKTISFVMAQKSQLFLELPLRYTFEFFQEIYGVRHSQGHSLLQDLVERFRLQDKLETTGRRLSLGQRMKAELVCCLLYSPQVVFLDEPTIGLDVNSAYEVRQFLKEINHRYGTTILLTTHNMDDVEELCPRSIIINHGRKIYDDSTHNLKQYFGTDITIDFITDEQLQKPIPQIKKLSHLQRALRVVCQKSDSPLVISYIISQISIHEINIHETSLEAVIAQVYQSPPSH